MALLEVRNLKVDFDTQDGVVHAVRDLSYSLEKGRTLAIVGESGSGKTQGAFALLGLRAWAFFTLVLSPISLGVFVVGEHFLRYRWHPEFDRASLRQTIRTWREGRL